MGAVLAIDALLRQQRVWRARPTAPQPSAQPTGHPALDALLPAGGWPEGALSEILIPFDGVGELQVVWPTLARLSQAGERVVVVGAPYRPLASAWQAAGLALTHVQWVHAVGRDAQWAAEQCLRSGSCGAVLCWLRSADDRILRRLQVAAETGQTLAFAYRPLSTSANPSPAALRLALDARSRQVRVLKCRGGLAPAQSVDLREA